jgi:hypothetical protein
LAHKFASRTLVMHGLILREGYSLDNNLDFWSRVEKFLDKHIGKK